MPAGIFPISTALCLTAAFQANAIPVFQSGGHSPLLPVPGDSVRVFAEITGAVQGMSPTPLTPSAFATRIQNETARWATVVRDRKIAAN